MNSNGQNRNNTFAGNVLIDGNLTVTGTYPGGGGGGSVDNPMTSNLDAGEYSIDNISSISGIGGGPLLTSSLDLQNNDIMNVNELKGRSDDNKLYISGNVEMFENLNMNGNAITNVNYIGSANGGADTIILNGDIKSNNGNFLDGITNITGYGSGDVLQLNGDIRITTKLDLLGNNIDSVEVLDVNYLVSTTNSAIRFNSPIYLETNMNASGKNIYNVGGLTCDNNSTIPTVDLNLDLVPLTEGKANQVLARDPAFNPANPSTYKLVWQTPSGGGGGVNNPMTVDLDAGGFNILNVESLSSNYVDADNINPKTGSSILVSGDLNLNSNGLTRVDRITCRTTATPSADLFLDLIPATVGSANQVLARDPAFTGGTNNNKLVWQTPATGGITNPLTANIQGAQYNMYDMNTLESKAINIMASGGGLSCMNGALQVPITWGIALKLSADPFYRTFNTDYITPATGAGVTIDSKLQDGKTDSRITLSSPSIVINNSTNPTPSAIEIKGNIQITNNSGHIQGDTLFLRGRTSGGVPTPFYIESSITNITSFTLNVTTTTNNFDSTTNNFYGTVKTNTIQPYTGSSVNITATDLNVSNHLNVLTNRSASIGVRTTLFKTFGTMPTVNINTLTPIKLNSVIVNQRGDNIIPAGAFINGDKFIIIMNGLLTSVGSGSLNIFLYVGAIQALSFSIINVSSTLQPCKITMEVDCTVSGSNVTFVNATALLSMERTNTSIRYSTSSASNVIDNNGLSNSIDVYVSQSATQVSTFTPLSYTIEQL